MRTDELLLQDMADAIAELIETVPATWEQFDDNKLLRSHVLRHIQIVGEAAWRISPAIKAQWPTVPWKALAGMRHVLVHDYFQVNWRRVYETARNDVPPLRAQVAAMLQSLSS